jgi:hypothetical protein
LRLPDDLPAYVEGWYKISEFFDQPDVSRNWLRDLKQRIRYLYKMSQLAPDTRTKLANKLLPPLIEHASTEADICRVMDNLGNALIGYETADIGSELLLLERMAGITTQQYGQEQPPVRLMTYIKMLIGEARHVPQSAQEAFLGRCLPGLLKHLNQETFDWLDESTKLWPYEVATEWNMYRDSLRALIIPEPISSATHTTGETPATVLARLNPLAWFKSDQHPKAAASAPGAPVGKGEDTAATMNGQNITREQVDRVYIVKVPYIDYTIPLLRMQIQQFPSEKAQLEAKIKDLEALKTDPQQMRQRVQEELIDDVLIQEEIAKITKNDAKSKRELEEKDRLRDVFREFKSSQGYSFGILLDKHKIREREVRDAVLIFVRREMFARYLGKHQKMRLEDWLARKRNIH